MNRRRGEISDLLMSERVGEGEIIEYHGRRTFLFHSLDSH